MKELSQCVVLIVDDTEMNINVLVEALGDDYELAVAIDGSTALEIMRQSSPDLVLLDIMMPNINGFEVCERMRQNQATANIPVIFLSALTDIESKSKGFELGAVDFIAKPFDIKEVKARVKTHLSLYLAQGELAKQNDVLNQRIEERTQELILIQEVTLQAMAGLSESRDPETGNHIFRTRTYVKLLAEQLIHHLKYKDQVDEQAVRCFYASAPLHDIGKIGIPDRILLKPGRLTDDEREIMKKHAFIGYSTLRKHLQKLEDNSFFRNAMEFAYYHHEKWDGSGYPNGLIGEAIPLSARLMAIADVYDALVSRRVYKEPYPHSMAVRIIKEGKGSHFDPDLVDVFLSIEGEIKAFAFSHADSQEERDTLLL